MLEENKALDPVHSHVHVCHTISKSSLLNSTSLARGSIIATVSANEFI